MSLTDARDAEVAMVVVDTNAVNATGKIRKFVPRETVATSRPFRKCVSGRCR